MFTLDSIHNIKIIQEVGTVRDRCRTLILLTTPNSSPYNHLRANVREYATVATMQGGGYPFFLFINSIHSVLGERSVPRCIS